MLEGAGGGELLTSRWPASRDAEAGEGELPVQHPRPRLFWSDFEDLAKAPKNPTTFSKPCL